MFMPEGAVVPFLRGRVGAQKIASVRVSMRSHAEAALGFFFLEA